MPIPFQHSETLARTNHQCHLTIDCDQLIKPHIRSNKKIVTASTVLPAIVMSATGSPEPISRHTNTPYSQYSATHSRRYGFSVLDMHSALGRLYRPGWYHPPKKATIQPLSFRHLISHLISLAHVDVPERVTYKMGVMVYRCLHGQAPWYLADHLITSWRRFSASSAFRKPTPARRTSLSTQHIRPSGVFHCWPDGLEFAAWRAQRSGVWFWQF